MHETKDISETYTKVARRQSRMAARPAAATNKPPQDIEAERCALGAMLLNPDAVGVGVEILKERGEEVFYHPPHQVFYNAVVRLFARGVPVDVITISGELMATSQLDAAGGMSYLAELTRAVPTSANIEAYARMVVEAATRRKVIAVGSQILAQAYAGEVPAVELVGTAVGELSKALDDSTTNAPIKAHNSLLRLYQNTEAMIERGDTLRGVPVGIRALDRMLGGFQPSDMIILGARPSVGKTAFMLSMVLHAILNGYPCIVFSLEMSEQSLAMRIVQQLQGVDKDRLRTGFLAKQELPKMRAAVQMLESAPFEICDQPGITAVEMRAKAIRFAKKYPGQQGIVAVDYLQLMGAADPKATRQEQVASFSAAVKKIARELNWSALALSQLNREGDGGMPRLSHLKESGAIEQDADVVLLLHRVTEKDKDGNEVKNGQDQIFVDVAKHRNGPTGEFGLHFNRARQSFHDIDTQVQEPVSVVTSYNGIREIENTYDEEELPW